MTTAVRPASPADIDRVVAVHQAAFGAFFLTSLGPRFLSRLYRGYLGHPSGVLLVIGDPVAGFVAGTTDPASFYRWLRRSQGPAMALAAVPALLRRPLAVGRRLASAVRYRGEEATPIPDGALLASLGVDPRAGGGGLGSALVEAFVERATEAGRTVTYCSTDAADNERVLAFYGRLGFREAERVRRGDGREMAVLIRESAGEGE
jgi:ribosomal protein S18 acetylase RimI-like enzyme